MFRGIATVTLDRERTLRLDFRALRYMARADPPVTIKDLSRALNPGEHPGEFVTFVAGCLQTDLAEAKAKIDADGIASLLTVQNLDHVSAAVMALLTDDKAPAEAAPANPP